MARKKGAILEPLLAKAISLGADQLEIEYKYRCEEVFAMKSGFGLGIGNFRGSSPEAQSFRNELYALAKKKQGVKIDEHTYEVRTRIFDKLRRGCFSCGTATAITIGQNVRGKQK
jgi:hypothetical protein